MGVKGVGVRRKGLGGKGAEVEARGMGAVHLGCVNATKIKR